MHYSIKVIRSGLLGLLLCLGSLDQTAMASRHQPTQLPCQDLALLTYFQMTAQQQQIANHCDQQQAAAQWQRVYGKLSSQDRLKATVYEPL